MLLNQIYLSPQQTALNKGGRCWKQHPTKPSLHYASQGHRLAMSHTSYHISGTGIQVVMIVSFAVNRYKTIQVYIDNCESVQLYEHKLKNNGRC